ncbi:MAG TPA: tRNA lysidine(34) synthetase TilS [Bacteroidales bacterium]|nr:tRNA lysidine(34) synthetase TilS [Bacteroidales bacterium]
MLAKFLAHITENELFGPSDKILLAVSGGVDSIVMTELFYRAGFRFAMVHCNFLLRGVDSDTDEKFVKNLAEKYKTRCYVKQFDTRAYSEQHKLSIQEAARDLRYNFFEEISKKENFKFIATAHHADDSIETFFINLLRGTGISGLSGIPAKQNKIIRPMLFAYKKDIEDYAKKNNIDYRYDFSNRENKYLRNKIRNTLLPALENISPGYRKSIDTTINNLKNTEIIYRQCLEKIQLLQTEKNELMTISIDKLRMLKPSSRYLYECIKMFGFNLHVCEDVCNSLDDIPGKIFLSPTHRMVKDREKLIIEKKKDTDRNSHFLAYEGIQLIYEPVKLEFTERKKSEMAVLDTDRHTALLDKDRLLFPLIIRKWQRGDYFYPLGLRGKKKLSDFFSDNKFSVIEKSNTWLLCSGDDIAWIIGHRIDERYKIKQLTQNILQIKWLQ